MQFQPTSFYFHNTDPLDSQPTGWYVAPGLDCVDGDGPFDSEEQATAYAAETEGYLREVFGCSLADLKTVAWRETLEVIRENAADGYPLDTAILRVVG